MLLYGKFIGLEKVNCKFILSQTTFIFLSNVFIQSTGTLQITVKLCHIIVVINLCNSFVQNGYLMRIINSHYRNLRLQEFCNFTCHCLTSIRACINMLQHFCFIIACLFD